MPYMQFMCRRLTVGSDDFFLPALVGLANRLVFGAVSVLFVLMLSPLGLLLQEGCEESTDKEDALFFLGVALALLAIGTFGVYVIMLYVSTRGTPLDGDRRHAMPYVLMVTLLSYVLELCMAVALTVTLIGFPRESSSEACSTLLGQKFIIGVSSCTLIWLDLVLFLAAIWLIYNSYDSKRVKGLALDDFDKGVIAWEGCFRVWCGIFRVFSLNLFGFVGSGAEADECYRSVAEIFNSWFHDSELSVSDLLCAMILVRLDQKDQLRTYTRYIPVDGHNRSEFYDLDKSSSTKAYKKNYNLIGGSSRAMTPSTPHEQSPGIKAGSSAKVESTIDLESGESMPVTTRPRGGTRAARTNAAEESEHDTEQAFEIFSKHYDYLPYIIGMYGWKLAMYANTVRLQPFNGLRKVLHMPGNAPDVGHGDNWCRCSQQLLLNETGIDPADVIYGNFDSVSNDDRKSISAPHGIFVDHKRRSVVISIRGTLSLQDLMTDAMIEPEPLISAGRMWGFNGAGHYAHAGMLKVALRIRLMLEKNGVLHRMFRVEKQRYETIDNSETGGKEAINVDLDKLPDCQGYELLVMGHSLGAAIAAILTLALQPAFPYAKCLSYANPGAVFSYELAEASKAWCTNVWLGNDVVPHLNWQSLAFLRIKVFDVLWRCKVSKARILRSALTLKSADDLLFEPYEVPDTPERNKFKRKMDAYKHKSAKLKIEQIPMYSPGVLIHMAKLETIEKRTCGGLSTRKQRVYEPHMVKDRTIMVEPIISTRSLLDHFPDLLPEVMSEIFERHRRMRNSPVGTRVASPTI